MQKMHCSGPVAWSCKNLGLVGRFADAELRYRAHAGLGGNDHNVRRRQRPKIFLCCGYNSAPRIKLPQHSLPSLILELEEVKNLLNPFSYSSAKICYCSSLGDIKDKPTILHFQAQSSTVSPPRTCVAHIYKKKL